MDYLGTPTPSALSSTAWPTQGPCHREMPQLAPRVLELRWLYDRVTLRKAQALSDIFVMAKTDPELSGRILGIEFEEEVTSELRSFAIHSVDYLCLAEYESLNWCDEVLEEAWLKDGLTKEEAAKVVALNTSLSTELFFELVREGDVLFESHAFASLGEIQMFLVSPTDERRPDRGEFKDGRHPSGAMGTLREESRAWDSRLLRRRASGA